MNSLALTSNLGQSDRHTSVPSRRAVLENRDQLNQFLATIERKALRIAQVATGNIDDALEIVQEAMMKLVEKYSAKPDNEWPPLFYRILNSKINDWYRKQGTRNRWLSWLPKLSSDSDYDPIAESPDTGKNPEQMLDHNRNTDALISQLRTLSPRQQQAFLLRAWEGLSVEETAFAMKCTAGSVKTHYSRAVHGLRSQLEDMNSD